MQNIQQKRIDRFRFLHRMYEITDGVPHNSCDMWDLGSELGYDGEYIEDIVTYLDGERLINHVVMGGEIAMTHRGRKKVEEALEKPNEETEYFPPVVNIINVKSMSQSQIVQGSSDVGDISINIENTDLPALKKAFESLLERVDELKASEEVTRQLVADARSALDQLNSPKPNMKVLGYLKKSVVDLLKSIAGSAIAAELLKPFV